MTERVQKALEMFNTGDNCAQAVFKAYADLLGITPHQAGMIACGFGGGMRAGELCGAASGAVMAIGTVMGNKAPEDAETRAAADTAVTEFNRRFKERFGTLICRELLGADSSTPEGKALLEAEPERKAICSVLITEAERIARELLAK